MTLFLAKYRRGVLNAGEKIAKSFVSAERSNGQRRGMIDNYANGEIMFAL